MQQAPSFLGENVKGWPVIGDFLVKRPKVALLRLSGVIADASSRRNSLSYARLGRLIDKAFDKADTAVVLIVNSPGGSPAQSSLIASHIRQRADESGLPVLAFVEDVAASGGYWLACAADEIHIQETSIVGSIGVIFASFGFEEVMARYGVKRRIYTAGKEKSFMDPFLPERKDDIERLQAIQKDMHAAFKDWVKERRGDRLKGADKSLFEGQFWTGLSALENGMVDGIGDMRSVVRDRFGEQARIIDLMPARKLPFTLPLFRGRATQSDAVSGDVLAAMLETLEERVHWSRYGL